MKVFLLQKCDKMFVNVLMKNELAWILKDWYEQHHAVSLDDEEELKDHSLVWSFLYLVFIFSLVVVLLFLYISYMSFFPSGPSREGDFTPHSLFVMPLQLALLCTIGPQSVVIMSHCLSQCPFQLDSCCMSKWLLPSTRQPVVRSSKYMWKWQRTGGKFPSL